MKYIKETILIMTIIFAFFMAQSSVFASNSGQPRGCQYNNLGCIEGIGCPNANGCFQGIGCKDALGCVEAIGCPEVAGCVDKLGCDIAYDAGCYTQLPVFIGGGMDFGVKILGKLVPGTGVIDNPSIMVVVLAWVKLFLILAGLIAFVAFLWAGAMYLTTFMNEEHAEKAKNIVIYTAIGLVVILMSYVLVSLFINAAV